MEATKFVITLLCDQSRYGTLGETVSIMENGIAQVSSAIQISTGSLYAHSIDQIPSGLIRDHTQEVQTVQKAKWETITRMVFYPTTTSSTLEAFYCYFTRRKIINNLESKG